MASTPFDVAAAAYRAGRYDEAAELARHALPASPDNDRLWVVVAMAEHELGHYQEAADAFRRLTELKPDSAEHWSNLGYMLRLCGQQTAADEAFQRALQLAPRAYGILLNHGLLLLDMHRYGAARHRFLDAYDVDPGPPDARIYGALSCYECGDADRAEALLAGREAWGDLDAELQYHLALVLMQIGRLEEAEALLDQGSLEGADTKTLASLAVLAERTNRLDRARALLERIRAHPDVSREAQVDALTVGSTLALRKRDYPEARACAQQLLAMGLSSAGEATAYFTLASIADREGRPAEAMEMLDKAHAIHLRFAEEMMPEIAKSDEEPLRVALDRMTPEEGHFVDEPQDEDVPSPVFIVGFPRSGTTMLEQMLDAHPGFVSMDEQSILTRCVDQIGRMGLRHPAELGRLSRAQRDALRAGYWEGARRIARIAPGQTLVDKNPLNLLRLPTIRRLFPSAKIIMALRHPCDVVLSCYMQDFRSPVFRVLCSTLPRLAGSYVNAMNFWIHHQALLKPDVLLLRYEDTVADLPGQVARIGAFLGTEDAASMEQFAEHARRKGFIGTPSYSQVVEPVNTRAVGRWGAYAPWFEPLLPRLRPVAEHWGYGLPA
jgi:tetratricopeptide (TPR) repeat protein